VCPNVGAVITDEDGDISNDVNVALTSVVVERAPLFEERELEKTPNH
jgi:hypothetical protein